MMGDLFEYKNFLDEAQPRLWYIFCWLSKNDIE